MSTKKATVKVVGRDLVPLGLRGITRMSEAPERYLLYLPTGLNELWRALYEGNIKVQVYVEIPGNDDTGAGRGGPAARPRGGKAKGPDGVVSP